MREPPLTMEIYPNWDELRRSSWVRHFLFNLLPIPLHIFFPLRQELYSFLVRLYGFAARRRYRTHTDMLVNLGSGANGKTGWVNVDMVKFPGVNCVYDCRKNLPFPNSSVRGIFCEHFLEHLDYTEELPYFLSECHRVLKQNGVIRIIVPDAEKYLLAYIQPDWSSLRSLRPLDADLVDHYYQTQYRTKMELINMVFRQGFRHKFAYDFETLQFVLTRYGFSKIVKQVFDHSLMPDLCIDQESRASESLYVEAVK